ncbi:MAG TPA: ROK family transcriptional regulator [Steroidobacteraceae bacterium]|jgi:predicted NBD/HSP70 family sugar kinase/predicted transcriptional regulator|nr:ROK family transcriptional regulator [Steroidobacteraceae bacterium]
MQKRQRAREIRPVDLSDVELASSVTARRINRDIVLELIRTRQPISRAELARQSGLQRSTVSQIIEQLLAEKWVCEGRTTVSQRGRRPTLIRLNESLVALAVDIHPRQAIIAMVDLNGRLISRSMAPLSRDAGASTDLIVEAMSRMKTGLAGMSIEGIGVSIPGRVDPQTDQFLFLPNLHWRDFDLKAAIERRMKLPTHLANAAIACLLAQLTFHHDEGNRDAVLITTAEGVGAAIFANGSIITGHDGMAGEFGHISIDPDGPECACGRRGCWELFASCRAALRYFRELQPQHKTITFSELLNLAEEGNAHAGTALERQAKEIGLGLRLVVAALSPAVVYIAGEITSAWHRYRPTIEKAVRTVTIAGTPPAVVPIPDGDLARLRGAAALVFQRRS